MNMLVSRSASTTEFEFNSIHTLFKKFELSWNNATGLGLDNTNSNIYAKNSIKQRAIEKNNIFVMVVHAIFCIMLLLKRTHSFKKFQGLKS